MTGSGSSRSGPPRLPGGSLGVAFTAGFTLLAGLFLGYYGGRLLDQLAGTTPWLTLVGIVLGVVAGFRIVLREILGGKPSPGRPREHDHKKPDGDGD